MQAFPLASSELFGVVQAVELEIERQNNNRRHDWASQWPTSRFIDSGNQRQPA
jgi:hypothetical protein